MILGNPVDNFHKFFNFRIGNGNLHALSAQYIGRAHQNSVAQLVGNSLWLPPPYTRCRRRVWEFRILPESCQTAPCPSAASTFSALVPRIGTPIFIRLSVSLMAVCPPNCTTAPSGCSMFTTFSTSSGVRVQNTAYPQYRSRC